MMVNSISAVSDLAQPSDKQKTEASPAKEMPEAQADKNMLLSEQYPIIWRRFKQIMLLAQVTFILALLNSGWFLYSQYDVLSSKGSILLEWLNILIFLGMLSGVTYVSWLARQERVRASVYVLVSMMPLGLMILSFLNGEFGKIAVMAYPIVVVSTAFFGNRRLALWVSVAFCLGVLVMFIAGISGMTSLQLYRGEALQEPMFLWHEAFYVWIIIICTYLIADAMVDDFTVVMFSLNRENDKTRAYAKSLGHIAIHDSLTGMKNRYFCEKEFTALGQRKSMANVVLLFIDLDDFKFINTRFGHTGGDRLLKVIAGRLQQLADSNGAQVARMGGDEFAMWSTAPETLDQAGLIRGIHKVAAQPVHVDQEMVSMSCSIGVATRDSLGMRFMDLFREADIALREAKKAGKNTQVYFEQGASEQELRRIKIADALRHAVEREEFELWYQPQIDLQKPGIRMAEALIRWRPEGGEVVPPDEFISIAEQSDTIVKMTDWALRQACHDCEAWQRAGYTGVGVSVNISPRVLELADLYQMVSESLAKTGLSAELLELEITESVMVEESLAVKQSLRHLRKLGVQFALDDFGTGYSNLAALAKEPFNKLKLDRQFVTRVNRSSGDQAIVSATVQIARSFNMCVVVEGVETQVVAAQVKALGCELAQGFLWSKPVPYTEFLALLSQPVDAT